MRVTPKQIRVKNKATVDKVDGLVRRLTATVTLIYEAQDEADKDELTALYGAMQQAESQFEAFRLACGHVEPRPSPRDPIQ